MGLLSTPPPGEDPKRQVGAYVVLGERDLYEIISLNDDGSAQVKNCKTGYLFRLSVVNLQRARLVEPLRDEAMADLEAAYEAAESVSEAA